MIRFLNRFEQGETHMKRSGTVVVVLLMLGVFAGIADAQKKSSKRAPVKKTSTVPPLDVRAAREKVDIQLSNVNVFVDKLGNVAQDLETASTDAKDGKLKPETADKIRANETKMVEAIRNLKTGLGTLESEFRTKPALQKYLPTIQGITDLAAQSEDSALAGKFVAAKDPLRSVSVKLTDTLAILPR
jgi:hypothetical protein